MACSEWETKHPSSRTLNRSENVESVISYSLISNTLKGTYFFLAKYEYLLDKFLPLVYNTFFYQPISGKNCWLDSRNLIFIPFIWMGDLEIDLM